MVNADVRIIEGIVSDSKRINKDIGPAIVPRMGINGTVISKDFLGKPSSVSPEIRIIPGKTKRIKRLHFFLKEVV